MALEAEAVAMGKQMFPGIERKDLAALGCPFPDDPEEFCVECSHHSPIFGNCDLGIEI
jgi:hypothetical protein